jgi:predicted acetyltransferase
MNFSISEATPEERPVVRHLLQLYLHDFSEFDGEEVNDQGLYHYPWVEEYWRAPKAAFLFKVAGNYAGFCLVDNDVLLPNSEHSISEFFVLRKHRRSGLGRFAASSIFSSRPGVWETAQHESNLSAQAYWRNVIAEYTNGKYAEQSLNTEEWHGPVLTFLVSTNSEA